MTTVLVTGASGFTGQYLVERLQQSGLDVVGAAMVASASAPEQCDLLDAVSVASLISNVQPEVVVHLAAVSFVGHADIDSLYRTNIVGTRNLLSALQAHGKTIRKVILASSANVYGNTEVGVATEDTPANPENDYAVSKLAMEHMARLWMSELPMILARPFNYTGVGQAKHFLIPKIVDHFRRRAAVIELGNLEIARDFSDVRTVVEAYARLVESALQGEVVNICSGHAVTIKEIISMCEGLSGHHMEVIQNPQFVRERDVRVLCGSNARLEHAIGPLPPISMAETLRWMLS